MPKFKYVATNKQGKKVSGNQEADNREQIANFLHEQGLVIISIDEEIDLGLSRLMNIEIGGMPLKEKVVFVKQLSTMLGAGLPLIQALDVMVEQSEKKTTKEKLQKVYKSVESGSSLSESFRQEGSIFSDLHLNLLEAGEKSGTMNQIMNQIAVDLEKSKNLKSKIVNAMIYPIVILVVMIVVFILLIIFMVPSVKELYAGFGVDELPAITNFMITLSETLSQPIWMITSILLIFSGVFGVRYYYTTPSGRRVIDKILLRIPVFGNLNTKIQLTQFSRLLAMLLESGVPIVESLTTVANAMSNSLFKDTIIYASQEVLKGNPLSPPLAKGEVFPLVMLKMLATGEETGKLDKIAEDMGEFYENEVNDITANLTKLMEPFILLLVGVMVGFIAVSIYLPLYSLGQHIK